MARSKETRDKKREGTARVQKAVANGASRDGAGRMPYAIAAIVIVILAAGGYLVISNYASTSISTFLFNFNSAPRVAVSIIYDNASHLQEIISCSTSIIQAISHTRNASSIDFFIMNSSTCYYSPTGLGHTISNISTKSAPSCLGVADSEPSIFLNYSVVNRTLITPYHLYVSGDSASMASCGVAVDLAK